MRTPTFLLALVLLAAAAPAASAETAPLGLTDCGEVERTWQCSGLVSTWDGVPLDTTVTFPSQAAARAGGLPLIAEVNGLGNSKWEYLDPASQAYTGNAYGWAARGYVVLTATARGFWGSCGTPESRAASPAACAKGWIHLADTRYEVRDTQELIGRLVDDGAADPARIGVTGDSYGGGQSIAMAALADRIMLPDGSLVPWRSPRGTALRLAAAAPVIPWTDLLGAIAPNGRPQALGLTDAAQLRAPVGVFKTSVANAIFAATTAAIGPGQPLGEPFVPGRPMGFLAPPGVDPSADVAAWVARADAGEPYSDPYIRGVLGEIQRFRSAANIPSGSAPSPLLVGSGFTDDIFPVDETLRYVNRLRREHPEVPVSLVLGDFGHQRAANKPADRDALVAAIAAWMDHHVKGEGPAPRTGVVATTQTCPRAVASEGPLRAASFAALAPDVLRLDGGPGQTVSSSGGDPRAAAAVDPAAGGGDGCAQTDPAKAPGTATYALPPAPAGGTLLLGAPRLQARADVAGAPPSSAQLAARLWDVAPDGTSQRLVARGLLRPTGAAREEWELHPAAYRFAAGHVAKLELLGADAPYGRPSNAAFSVAVTDLRLELPVRGSDAAGARSCASRRRFTLRPPPGLRAVRATVAGRRVALRRGRVLVDLRGRPRGTVEVRLRGRTRAGRVVEQVRRFRTCAARRR